MITIEELDQYIVDYPWIVIDRLFFISKKEMNGHDKDIMGKVLIRFGKEIMGLE